MDNTHYEVLAEQNVQAKSEPQPSHLDPYRHCLTQRDRYLNDLSIKELRQVLGREKDCYVVNLTIDDFRQVLTETLASFHTPGKDEPQPQGRYVYGLRGIQDLFNVSHKTAQSYKDGILKPAIYQYGRKIVVDADKALELFRQAKEEVR